jgi:hypothetical protein
MQSEFVSHCVKVDVPQYPPSLSGFGIGSGVGSGSVGGVSGGGLLFEFGRKIIMPIRNAMTTTIRVILCIRLQRVMGYKINENCYLSESGDNSKVYIRRILESKMRNIKDRITNGDIRNIAHSDWVKRIGHVIVQCPISLENPVFTLSGNTSTAYLDFKDEIKKHDDVRNPVFLSYMIESTLEDNGLFLAQAQLNFRPEISEGKEFSYMGTAELYGKIHVT